MNRHPVTFVSVWDGGYEISTPAILDLDTGIVSDIESVDVGDGLVETLDGEFVELDDLRAAIFSDDGIDYAYEDGADLAAFVARIGGPSLTSRKP